MGVSPVRHDAAALPPGPAQDLALKAVADELSDKGFVIAQLDKLVNWARTGSLWPMTFGLACCAVEIVAAGASVHHLDGAAGEPKSHRPQRAGARPADQRIDRRSNKTAIGDLLGRRAQQKVLFGAGRDDAAGGQSHSHSSAPFRHS